MKSLLLFLVLYSIPARADLLYKEVGTIRMDGEPPRASTREIAIQKSRMRADSQTSPGGVGFLVANERGFYSCAPSNKMCVKMGYTDGVYSLFGHSPASIKLLSMKLTPTGNRKKLQGYTCDDYNVEKVMETETDDFTDGSRTTVTETNCYSPQFAKLFPPEALRALKDGIDKGKYSAQVKKLLLDEVALGIPMKRKSSSKSVSKDKKTPLPSIDLDQTVVSVKTGTINHHLFFPPKDYTIQDGDRALSSMKQMRDSMDKFSAKAVRPTLPPEALQKLRQMRNSGKLTREQQKQIDLILE